MVVRDQKNVVLFPHLIEALNDKWDEVVRHTCKWLIKDDEEIFLSGSALGDQFKEQYFALSSQETHHVRACYPATHDDVFVLLLQNVYVPVRKPQKNAMHGQ